LPSILFVNTRDGTITQDELNGILTKLSSVKKFDDLLIATHIPIIQYSGHSDMFIENYEQLAYAVSEYNVVGFISAHDHNVVGLIEGDEIPQLGSDCVLRLDFDEGSGNTVYDKSPYRNNGTIYGASWVDGKYGKALSFDGEDDYVEVPNSESLDITDAITVEVWVKPTVEPRDYNMMFIQKGDDTSNDRTFYIYNRGVSDELHFGGYDSLGNLHLVRFSMPSDYKNGVWSYLVLVKDSNGLRAYYNGMLKGFDDTFTENMRSNTDPVMIGVAGTLLYFNGIIDEVRIYNRALSEEEIKAHFIRGAIPRFSGTIPQYSSLHGSYEAEDYVGSGGTVVNDSDASGGKAVSHDGSSSPTQMVYFTLSNLTSQHYYVIRFRGKSASNVSNSMKLKINDTTDNILIKDLMYISTSPSYQWSFYYPFVIQDGSHTYSFEITAENIGDDITRYVDVIEIYDCGDTLFREFEAEDYVSGDGSVVSDSDASCGEAVAHTSTSNAEMMAFTTNEFKAGKYLMTWRARSPSGALTESIGLCVYDMTTSSYVMNYVYRDTDTSYKWVQPVEFTIPNDTHTYLIKAIVNNLDGNEKRLDVIRIYSLDTGRPVKQIYTRRADGSWGVDSGHSKLILNNDGSFTFYTQKFEGGLLRDKVEI